MTNSPFVPYGASHWIALVTLGVAYFTLWFAVHRADRGHDAARWAPWLGVALLLHEIVNIGLHYAVYGYPWIENLPLNFCRANMLVAAWMLLRRSFLAYEVSYFWAMVGSVVALVTPNLTESFPHPLFFTFFVGHGLGIFAVLFATWAFGFAPRLRSIAVTLTAAVGLALIAWPVNAWLGTNYLYLDHAPEASRLVEIFEPWPGYLVGTLTFGVVACFVAYLPFVRWASAAESGGRRR